MNLVTDPNNHNKKNVRSFSLNHVEYRTQYNNSICLQKNKCHCHRSCVRMSFEMVEHYIISIDRARSELQTI